MLYEKLITSHLSYPKPILADGVREWTYREIDRHAKHIAKMLSKCGVRQTDRVFIAAEHSIRTIFAVLACLYLGACAVPIPEKISSDDLKILLADASPKALIDVKDFSGTLPVLSINLDNERENITVSRDLSAPSNLAYILYTSGSTGTPKGVMAPQKQVAFCIDAINRRLKNSQQDRILCCLPLSFDYGLYQIFLALAAEAYLVLPPNGPLQAVATWLYKQHITGFPAMPAMLNMLLKSKVLERVTLPCLRYITSTGDTFPVQLIERLMTLFPNTDVIPMYGLTECKRVSILPIGRKDKALAGSCGLPLDGVSVRLIDKDIQGIGELVVSGENVMAGYWEDPAITEQFFFHDPIYGNSLKTGDLFKLDNEGFLYFWGRKKRILKVNGYRIGAPELEERILQKMGTMLDEIRVVGRPDEICGEQIAVCVTSRLPIQEVAARLMDISSAWSSYQQPNYLFCSREPLPKTQNGKIDETALRRRLTDHDSSTVLLYSH